MKRGEKMIERLIPVATRLKARADGTWNQLRFVGWRFMKKAANWVLRAENKCFGRKFKAAHVSCMDYLLHGKDRNALLQEIKISCDRFGYLLEPSYLLVQGAARPVSFSSLHALHEAWLYALDDTPTTGLHQLYQSLLELQGWEMISLKAWMEFLQKQGLHRVDEALETLTVTHFARRWYENCLNLADNEVLPIETHPWEMNGKLAAYGRLKR